jgi:hypothetical protein
MIPKNLQTANQDPQHSGRDWTAIDISMARDLWPNKDKADRFVLDTEMDQWTAALENCIGHGDSPLIAIYHLSRMLQWNEEEYNGEGKKWDSLINFLEEFVK